MVTRGARRCAALALASVALTLPSRAHALSCELDTPRFPQEGATAVPTNAVLLGYGYNSSERLRGPDGEEVPVERRSVRAPFYATPTLSGLPVLVPLEELEPDSVYRIEVDENARWGIAEPSLRQIVFATGPGPSVAPPPLPVLIGAEPHVGRGFDGPGRSIRLEFAHQGLLITDLGSFGPVTSVDDLFLDPTASADDPVSSRRLEWVTTDQGLSVGYGDCLSWPSMAGERENARFGVLDLAGNFSGWVDVELVLPSREEAEAAAQAQQAAGLKKLYGKREGRPPVCTFTPSRSGSTSGIAAWLTLGLAGVLAAGRRFRRLPR
jgi:hypothetical protein